MSATGARGSILVVGGGISGITAAVEASEAGADVVLVEKLPFLGGRVARLNQYFPKLCPPTCGLEINLRTLRTSPRIRCLTLSEVERITGEPGGYTATVRRDPRFVTERCTACGACVEVCPVERPDAFNLGMGTTRAVYLPFEMATPMRYAIDADACRGDECGACVAACPYGAIDLATEPETIEVEVDAVVWATGWDPPDAARFEGLGFGQYPDVVTNVMLERLAAPGGPTGGRILRPSTGEEVRSVAFVQCAGSRDENYLSYCSGVCCMASLKQARYVREQVPDADITVYYIDIRSPGRLEDFYAAAQADDKLSLIKGKVANVVGGADGLEIEVEDTASAQLVRRSFDMVVLATGMVPVGVGGAELDSGPQQDAYGFLRPRDRSGMLTAGCAKRPADVATCVRDATAAVGRALEFCGEGSRG